MKKRKKTNKPLSSKTELHFKDLLNRAFVVGNGQDISRRMKTLLLFRKKRKAWYKARWLNPKSQPKQKTEPKHIPQKNGEDIVAIAKEIFKDKPQTIYKPKPENQQKTLL
jgi:hypothetical protein